MMRDDESQGPVIRDRRRIDPTTGQVRDAGESGPQRGPAPGGGQHKPGKHSVSTPGSGSASGTAAGAAGSGVGGRASDERAGSAQAGTENASQASQDDKASQLTSKLAERTADLQRLQAEYANYRKRVERDRLAVREQALANVLNELLPVLDDIGRARDHGELTAGFKSVAESLEGIAVKLGLTSYGEVGDPFDPMLHEALLHSYSADVSEPTCVQILQPGYKVGERIIRPARVAVAEPTDGDAAVDVDPSDAGSAAEARPTQAQAAEADNGPGAAASSDPAHQQERPEDGGPTGGQNGDPADGPSDAGV